MTDFDAVPDDWEPDCDNCRWILEHFAREDLYLFEADGLIFSSGQHVNPIFEASMRDPATDE